MADKQDTTGKELAVGIAKIALADNCCDVEVIDLRGKSPATDFFVIATGTSDRQSRTVADHINEYSKKEGFRRFGQAGYDQGKWILIDLVEVVVHIFDAEYRDYYQLETLWGDGHKLSIK